MFVLQCVIKVLESTEYQHQTNIHRVFLIGLHRNAAGDLLSSPYCQVVFQVKHCLLPVGVWSIWCWDIHTSAILNHAKPCNYLPRLDLLGVQVFMRVFFKWLPMPVSMVNQWWMLHKSLNHINHTPLVGNFNWLPGFGKNHSMPSHIPLKVTACNWCIKHE